MGCDAALDLIVWALDRYENHKSMNGAYDRQEVSRPEMSSTCGVLRISAKARWRLSPRRVAHLPQKPIPGDCR